MYTTIKIDDFDYEPQEVSGEVSDAWHDCVGRRMTSKVPPKVDDFNKRLYYFTKAVDEFTSLDLPQFEYESLQNAIERCEA